MIKIFFLAFIILCCNNCIKTIHVSGHLFEEEEMKALEKAKSKQDIEVLLGSPTATSSFGQETWYYITTKKETIAFLPDTILEQNIVAISFKQDNLIDKVSRYNEEDAQRPKLISEYTITKGTDTTTTQQLLGNVGRFSANKPAQTAKPRSGF